MKITGTKKLSIILLSLGCTVAAGLGVLFGGFSDAPKVYARSSEHVLPVGDEDIMLKEFSADCGISEEELKFYALSNNGTVEILYQYYLMDKESAVEEILNFLYDYSQGRLSNSIDLSDEDWYVAPDDVGNYDFYAYHVCVGDTFTFYTTKAFITNESFYWRQKGFQWGHMSANRMLGPQIGGSYYSLSPTSTYSRTYWDSAWIYDIVWLDEGEEYTFGVTSSRKCAGIYTGAMTTDFFFDSYFYDKQTNASRTDGYVYNYYTRAGFSDYDDNTPPSESDPAMFEPDTLTTNGTKGDYRDEFGSSILCNNGSNGSFANTPFLSWTNNSVATTSAGVHYLKLATDAPSGVYYMSFYYPYVGSSRGVWSSTSTTAVTQLTSRITETGSITTSGGSTWSNYLQYAVLVCRIGLTAPEAEYGEGVSADFRNKTVSYTGEPATFTLKGDWGPGLSSILVEQKINGVWTAVDPTLATSNITTSAKYEDAAGNTVTCTREQLRGRGVQADVTYVAKNAGEYRITYTPFKKWSDGTTAPVVYNFTIKPMQLTKPTLVQEEGVNQATNTKYVYATNKDQYVSLYPVPSKWAEYSCVADAGNPWNEFNYSTNGVLTISGRGQDVYKIKVKLKDTVNTSWNDGSSGGSIADLEFIFEIGPEKVVVPDIIQDTGNIGATRKEVVFNGATQSMSFMPINPEQLDITVYNRTENVYLTQGIDYETKQNTLRVNAFDAGEYEIKIKVKDKYIFENITKELIFELIIREAEITAPVLDEPTAVNYTKTVTYGGEKITMPDGTVQDWVATLKFQDADEARVTPVLNGLGQQGWGDSTLILAARAAGTYSVSFVPKKNYRWKSGVVNREYTLVIEKLKIAMPELVDDGEQYAKFSSSVKSIGFDGEGHPISLTFPTLEETKNTPYTKKSSIYIIRTSGSSEVWNAAGDTVTFRERDASDYVFTIRTTNNYCWSDGSTRDLIFTLKIIPVNVDALKVSMTDYRGGGNLEPIDFNYDLKIFQQTVSFDGTPKTVRIGNVGADDSRGMYITDKDDPYAKYFLLLDENGNGDDKLKTNMTKDETGGFLTITAIDAGVYRIGVYIRNTNFWWTETSSSLVEYRLVIEAHGMAQPVINENSSVAGNGKGSFEKNARDGKYSMTGTYNARNFVLTATFGEVVADVNIRKYIEITDPNGAVYAHVPSLGDSDVLARANEALKDDGAGFTNEKAPQDRVYTDWRDGKLSFYAKNQGSYTWKVKIVDEERDTPNYKWSGTNTLELSFTIVIKRSPVSGLEMHYVGDTDERETTTANGITVGKTDVVGSDSWAATVRYDSSVFSDKEKEIFFVRTGTKDLVNTGFSAQYGYSIKAYASLDGYDVSKLKVLDSNGIFNDDRLTLFALDAGRYEVTFTPNDNYCWNDTANTVGPVTFTLVINKRELDKPVIINDDGTKMSSEAVNKEMEFNREYQTFRLFMEKYPQGYAIGEFRYDDKEGRVNVDFAPTRTTQDDVYPLYAGTGAPDVKIGVDAVNHTLAVQAKSAGEYFLKVVVGNANNYEFSKSINTTNNWLQYNYVIKKLKVELPTAYLSEQNLSAAEAEKRILDKSQIKSEEPGVEKYFEAQTFYTVSAEFNGRYRTVYFYGDDVAKGDFNFTVTATQTTSQTDIANKIIQPSTVLDQHPSDNTQQAGYFMLAAQLVDNYAITLTFVTKDFYWSTDSQDAPTVPRTFTFNITKNNIEVPKLDGFVNEPLINNSYTATYTYEIDYGGTTANGAVAREATLLGVMLGEKLPVATPTPNEIKYSNMTVRIHSVADAGHPETTPADGVIITAPENSDLTAGRGNISFETAAGGVKDGALVTRTYCIELEINPQNSKWSIGDETVDKRYFYITVTKMQISRPAIDNPDTGTKYERSVTYYDNKAERWQDALILNGYDSGLMSYAVSPNITEATDIVKLNVAGGGETAGFVTAPQGDYKDKIKLSTKADAGKYVLTVSLADPDNTEWYKEDNKAHGGGTDDLEYDFLIKQIKVAKPYIENVKAPTTAVVGLTKTVTYQVDAAYRGVEQSLEIGNYWYTPDTPAAGTFIPEVMGYTMPYAALNTGFPEYNAGEFSAFRGQSTLATGAMLYNDFNDGLLKIAATDAGKYVIRFALTGNAVWADGSDGDIDITLLIKKIEVEDLKIITSEPTTVSGNTRTVIYNIDGNGNETVHEFALETFDWHVTNIASLISGTATATDSNTTPYDGYLSDKSVKTDAGDATKLIYDGTLNGKYYFTASKADTYEIEFKLTDGNNYRWKYADTATVVFKFIVNKLQLERPVIVTDYKLKNETINDDAATHVLEVDFDLREHTLLVLSKYEKYQTGKGYSVNTGLLGENGYFTVGNATAYNASGFTQTTHPSEFKSYDDMTGVTLVEQLFEILGVNSKFSYDGPDKGAAPKSFVNTFALTAYKPGEYVIAFTIPASQLDNVCWQGVTGDTVSYTLIINKYSHAAPVPESGDPQSKEYTAEDVKFSIVNAYNGIADAADYATNTVTGTVSEKFVIDNYVGNDQTLTDDIAAAKAIDTANGNDDEIEKLSAKFLSSWYDGKLILAFKSVGTYDIIVKITDTDNISWNNSSATEQPFRFRVLPATLSFNYKYVAKKVANNLPAATDIDRAAQNEFGKLTSADTARWPLSAEVEILVTITGLRHGVDASGASTGNIDSLLGFSVYYEDVSASTPASPSVEGVVNYDKVNTNGWMTGKLEDGTWAITLSYSEIPFGQGNITKGNYALHIVQDTDTDPATMNPDANPSNYSFADPAKAFVIDPDPAPFKGHEDMLTWSYSRSDWPAGMPLKLIENIGLDSNNRFELDYKAGVTYTFYAGLNAAGMAGHSVIAPPATLKDALESWQVTTSFSVGGTGSADIIYGGTQAVTNAGKYSVSIVISAKDADLYAYDNYTFELFYEIKPAKLNLNALGWDYDGSQAFVFDGTAKTVNVTGLAAFTDLSIDRYETEGSFTSAAQPTPVTNTIPAATSNSMTYAGTYTTKVFFKITGSNYATPDATDGTSYAGTFEFSVNWEIKPKELTVEWLETLTSSSDGETVTKTSPVIASPNTAYFDGAYTYEKDDNGTWVTVTAITRVPGTVIKYRATPHLKSTPSNPATDYARNYTFRVLGAEVLEFEVGGDDTVIINHIEVGGTETNGKEILPVIINGTTATEFEYTGNVFKAANVIDLDTTNGLISSMTVTVLYYNANDLTVAIPEPSAVGSYVVKLKLSYTGATEDYAFDISEAKFDIVKAKIAYSDFEWHFIHSDGENTIEAKWDAKQSKWINIADNGTVKLEYDEHAYEIRLSSGYAATVIDFIYTENVQIDADTYKTTVTPSIGVSNVNNYEFDANDPIPTEYEWTVEQYFLDLSKVAWNYTKAYEYTLVNGTPKAFGVELKNLPEYLLDKIVYTTVRVNENDKVPQTGDIVNAGNYETTVSFILEEAEDGTEVDLIDHKNYKLGDWPSAPFATTLSWTVNRKEMELPANDASWSEFDGIQHNLLKPFKLDVDWNEYFDIDVTYTALGSSEAKPYDGTSLYGGKYYAYDAGIYGFNLKIHTDPYNKDYANIVWVVRDGGGYKRTDDNQTVTYTVGKKALKVIGWDKNYESSKVILLNGIDPSKFVEYNFYEGDAGAVIGKEVDLDRILDSAGGELFSMVPVVKTAFGGNITVTFDGTGNGYEYISFETQKIDETKAKAIGDKPYIFAYSAEGGGYHRFNSEELENPFVIYEGKQVEFLIYNWEKYKDYVTVWNGSIDDLKQTQAGKYSITLVLRKDLETPLYWGVKDGKVDRSSVTLNFEIRYRMLTIPEIPDEIVYDGTSVNILDKAVNAKLSALLSEYGEYVTITGNTATDVGEQMLYLAIKDEYGNAVRWNDLSEQGLLGTYSKLWKITPVLLVLPERDKSKLAVEYDGTAHTVYEFLVGYDAENVPEAIKDLIKHVNATNAEAINQGTYGATLSLPNGNFSWCSAGGKQLDDRSPFKCDWTIDPQLIDFSGAYWGYMDGDDPVRYDGEKPFIYAVKNGVAQYYSLQIMGMPEILKLYATYTTNGAAGNSACRVDTYKTRVAFDLTALENNKNYTIGNQLDAGLAEITWKIVFREFEKPSLDDSWSVYDGEVHDVVKLLGLGDDWYEYFNIKVEYKAVEGVDWSAYNGGDMLVVGFSNYKVYNFGFYRFTVSLKANDPVLIPDTNIAWKDGAPEEFILAIRERTVTVTGWFEDNENSYALFDEETLPKGIEDKLEYLIYSDERDENGELKKTPVSVDDILPSTTYYMELKFKDGTDAAGVKYEYGVNLAFADGVRNPYEFGKFNFAGQSIIWLPIPVLETAVLEYNGDKQTFVIKDGDTLYKMSDAQRLQLNQSFNLNLGASEKSFIYLQDTKSLTVTAAGEYTAVVRLLGKVRLSWYDSEKYYASVDGKTLYEIGEVNPVSDPESLFDNKSVILKFKVTPKKVPALTAEELEKLFGLVIGYNGTERDVTLEAEIFAELEAKYGKIFDYDGSKGTAADIYHLVISLADNDSCSWYNPDKFDEISKTVLELGGYRIEYVLDGGVWRLAVVRIDADGNVVIDSANKPVEYFDEDGGYRITVSYQHDFEKEYVSLTGLLDGDGKPDFNQLGNFLFEADGQTIVRIDGKEVRYEYELNADGTAKRYKENPAGSGNYEEDSDNGDLVLRYKLSLDGEKEYGYKVFVYEDKTEYTYLFDSLPTGGTGHRKPIIGLDGKYITIYAVVVPGGYELRRYSVDADGEFVLDVLLDTPKYDVVETSCLLVDTDFYSIVNGRYVSDTNGAFILRYVLKQDGTKERQAAYLKDLNGNYVIDQDGSAITVIKYAPATGKYVIDEVDGKITVTRTEFDGLRYEVDWRIDSSVLAIPEFDETLIRQYTGKTLYAKDVLKGFIPDLMEIVEGGEAINAGEYTAKIVITTPNSKWNPDITTENFVLVKWRIDTAKLNLQDVKWSYNDGTSTYEDSSSFVYTRKDGKPVVYWVELANLPVALQDRVVYTTNKYKGAYAGINVGKYETSFTFDIDANFETVDIPDTLEREITWSIGRRMLQIPEVTSVFMVFDNTSHDLLELLGVPEDWNEYYDIDVKYSNGGGYEEYKGFDGKPYAAYNSGAYSFTFTIKPGINTSVTNPNVVWLKSNGETEVPVEDDEDIDAGGDSDEEAGSSTEISAYSLIGEDVEESAGETVSAAPAVVAVEQQTEQIVVKSEAIQALEQVCDRIKKLVCGAEVQMNSFRKYNLRGTL